MKYSFLVILITISEPFHGPLKGSIDHWLRDTGVNLSTAALFCNIVFFLFSLLSGPVYGHRVYISAIWGMTNLD